MKKIMAAVLCVMMVAAFFATSVSAKNTVPRNGMYTDAQGNTYIYKHGKMRLGWVTYKGHRYYCHYSKSRMYPKGAIAKNTYRVKNNKLYYFDDKGRKITKDTRYIGLNRHSTSVHYIYAPGMGGRRYRYNANHKRYQYLTDSGKWKDTGKRCYPYGMIDWQW